MLLYSYITLTIFYIYIYYRIKVVDIKYIYLRSLQDITRSIIDPRHEWSILSGPRIQTPPS